MASEADKKELVQKISSFVREKYGDLSGDSWQKAFAAEDKNQDGLITASELESLLKKADVGNGFTRGFWVSGVLDEVGAGDKKISLAELMTAISPQKQDATTTPPVQNTKPVVTGTGQPWRPLASSSNAIMWALFGAFVFDVMRAKK